MSDERQKFFRPWNSADESKKQVIASNNQEISDNDDNSSTTSSSFTNKNYNIDNDSARLASSPVSSVEDTSNNSSLRSLNQFVESHQLPNDNFVLNSLQNDQLLAQHQLYSCQDWPMIPLGPNYMWEPISYHTVQVAVDQIQQQEARAKRIKKLRPKRFRCRYCCVGFSNKGQLSGHERIHTGEKPFKCSKAGCGKAFTRNEELTRHKRIHTGLRPHSCKICGKNFGRKDHLKKHTKTHENQNMYNYTAAAAAARVAAFHSPYVVPTPYPNMHHGAATVGYYFPI